jgi:hypothetical protein
MVKDSKPDWRLLCEQAAKETDFNKLLELTAEITRLLDQREECLDALAERVAGRFQAPMSTVLSTREN